MESEMPASLKACQMELIWPRKSLEGMVVPKSKNFQELVWRPGLDASDDS
jgi:hypothetical protein